MARGGYASRNTGAGAWSAIQKLQAAQQTGSTSQGTGIALLGDSITAKNFFSVNGGWVGYMTDGYFNWANVALRQRARLTGIFGYSGQQIATVASHIPEVLATKPHIVVFEPGINDINNDKSLAQMQSDYLAALNALWAGNVHVVALTIGTQNTGAGGTYSASRRLITFQFNAWLKGLGATTRPLTVVDTNATITDPANGNAFTGMLRDGVHTLPLGSGRFGGRLARALASLLPDIDVLSGQGDPTNLVTTLPSTWGQKDASGGTLAGGTVTFSTVARTDDVPGSWFQAVMAGAGGFSLQGQIASGWAPGDTVIARMEYERGNDWPASLGTANQGFRLTLRTLGTFYEAYALNNNSGDTYPSAAVPLSGVIETAPMVIPTGASALYIIPEFAAAAGTLRIGRCEVRKVTAPVISTS